MNTTISKEIEQLKEKINRLENFIKEHMEHKDYRQDEREEAAFQRYESERDKEAFVQGAAWADEHPKRGMVDIEEVCSYIANNMRCNGYTCQTKFKFIQSLRDEFKKN